MNAQQQKRMACTSLAWLLVPDMLTGPFLRYHCTVRLGSNAKVVAKRMIICYMLSQQHHAKLKVLPEY